jgi:hypothetical protein
MTTAYPGGLDSPTNPVSGDATNSASVPHATQHANLNDAVKALEVVLMTRQAAPTLTSGTTIAPTAIVSFVSGTTDVVNITAPTGIATVGGWIRLIPTGIFHTTTAGNIALATTAVVGKTLTMTYDPTTAKFYPSY